MKNQFWSFPENEAECLELLSDGLRPAAGGTFLVKTPLNVKGLFVLPDNDFNFNSESGSIISLGASLTYNNSFSILESIQPDNIISKAVGSAAATPLRNRITIGGSIASMPKWSDLPGPLAVSGAAVVFSGTNDRVSFRDYVNNKKAYKDQLIKSVEIKKDKINGSYFRFTITKFDYPFFTLSTLNDGENTTAVTGTSNGLILLKGSRSEILDRFDKEISFNNERDFSGKYLKSRAYVELSRLLEGSGK